MMIGTIFIATVLTLPVFRFVVVVSGFQSQPRQVPLLYRKGRLLAAVQQQDDVAWLVKTTNASGVHGGPGDRPIMIGGGSWSPSHKFGEVLSSQVEPYAEHRDIMPECSTSLLYPPLELLMSGMTMVSLLLVATTVSPAMAYSSIVAPSSTSSTTIMLTASSALAGPIPSALLAWAHFVGLMGVAASLVAERLLVQRGMTVDDEKRLNNVDGLYGLSALSLLVSGYFRTTDFAKGWDFYQHEPIFWLKMASVAVLGALSFFPTIVLFRRDQARRNGQTLPPLSDAIIDRMTTIINAELLAVLTIPLLASLMARGVGYWDDFPWIVGAVLYVLTLGGAGVKYGREAFALMESEGSLLEEK
jgi:putative membrane protein